MHTALTLPLLNFLSNGGLVTLLEQDWNPWVPNSPQGRCEAL